MLTIRHIALFVPDLKEAEAYYGGLFDMELIGREVLHSDGLWYTLHPRKGWAQAAAAGIEIGMVALRRDALVLALFSGDPQPGQLYIVGLNMDQDEIAAVRARLPDDVMMMEDQRGALTFRDSYMITWQIYRTGSEFRSRGEAQNRWL